MLKLESELIGYWIKSLQEVELEGKLMGSSMLAFNRIVRDWEERHILTESQQELLKLLYEDFT